MFIVGARKAEGPFLDDAEAMTLAVAQGALTEVSDIATELRRLGIVT